MKRVGLVLLTFSICTYLSAGVTFAQVKLELAVAKASAQTVTPTQTPNTTQPTANPTPATTTTPAPTSQVTPGPTAQPKESQPTDVQEQSQQVETPGPTATPKPAPPTPTSKPKPILLPVTKKPPAQPINSIITAPFDLVMNSLPQSYYSDEGLTPVTNRILFALAAFSLLSGTILLSWPAILRTKKRLFMPAPKERKSLPYLAGRV